MKTLLISVTAICLVGILVEILLTEGQTKKYIQGVLSLAIIFVLLTQLVTLIKGSDTVLSSLTDDEATTVTADQTVLNKIEMARYNNAIETITEALEDEGITQLELEFSYGYDSTGAIFIQNIYINTANAVINKEDGNININDKIIEACQSTVDIEKDGIIIDGKACS